MTLGKLRCKEKYCEGSKKEKQKAIVKVQCQLEQWTETYNRIDVIRRTRFTAPDFNFRGIFTNLINNLLCHRTLQAMSSKPLLSYPKPLSSLLFLDSPAFNMSDAN